MELLLGPTVASAFTFTQRQVGSSTQRGFGQAGSGRVLPPKSGQPQPRAAVTSLRQGHQPAEPGQEPAWHRAPGAGRALGWLGRATVEGSEEAGMALRRMKAGAAPAWLKVQPWDEGPACLSSQGPDKSRWQITSARQRGATASFGTVSFLFPL